MTIYCKSISHLNSKCLSALQIFNRLKELPVHRTAFPLAIRPTSKQTFSIRSHAIFLSFMTFIKNCCQSETLRNINSTSSFNFVHLAKLWCVTFYGQYTLVFCDIVILLGEAVTSLLGAQIDSVALTQNSSLCQIGHFWLYSVQ